MTDQETDQETDNETDPMRAFAQALFAPAEDDETDEPDETEGKPSGYVATEGRVIEPPPDDPMRAFVHELFQP